MDSIFSRIIKGELPSYKIMENEFVFAFLAKDQVRLGHTLMIPKVEVDSFLEVPEPYYSAVFTHAKPVGQAIQRATDCVRIVTAIVGYEVPHFHYHLIPSWSLRDLDFSQAQTYPEEKMEGIRKAICHHLTEMEISS